MNAVLTFAVETRRGSVRITRAGAGPPLVLLHGNGHSWREFEPVFEALSKRFDVIAWDMPGQGGSVDAPPTTSIGDYCEALSDVIDALSLERPALLGSSVGAFIAAQCAITRIDIAAVVLEEMQFRTREFWLAAWPMVEKMFGATTQTFEQVQVRFCRKVDEALLGEWNAGRERAGAAGLIGVMAAIRDYPVHDALARLRAPTLLLFGAQGPTVEMAEPMHRAMPGAILRIIEDAGHFISIDQPAAFAAAVGEFLVTSMAGADAPVGSAQWQRSPIS